MTSKLDIGWLAGFLEGEGHFAYDCSPGIRLGSTDKDIVERTSYLLGGNHIRGPYQYRINKKPVYYTEIWALRAICWMMTIYPLMGIRRKQRIKEIIERWKKAPTKANRYRVKLIPKCHPERRHFAHGLCRPCYDHNKRKKAKEVKEL